MSEPFPPTVTGVGQTPTQPPPVIPTTTNMPSSTTAGAMPGTMATTPGMTSTMPGSATMPMATDTLMTDPLDRKLILVCGGTGNQGGAVVNRLLSTGRYRVRVLTRDVNSIRARELVGRGVDVVAGDMSDLEALKKAMLGCYGVFSVQTPFRGHQTLCAEEIIHGNNVADAAKMCNIQHLVYSSVASADRAPKVAHFDSKWKIEQHIIALGVPYTILRPTYFMENFLMGPTQITRGKIPGFTSPHVKQYYVAVADIGVFAELAFSHPEDYLGRTIEIAGDRLDGRELTLLFDRLCPGYAPFKYAPISRTLLRVTNPEMYQMAKWMDDVGYKVDLLEVRRRNPYMRTVEQWATEQGFATRQLPAHAASACQLL